MSERSDRGQALGQRLEALVAAADLPWKRERLMVLDAQISEPGFWDDPQAAAKVNQERTQVADEIQNLDGLTGGLSDLLELLEMAEEESADEDLAAIDDEFAMLDRTISGLEFKRMLSGEHDGASAYVQIKPGAGGTESMDWAGMLYRMVTRYTERKGWRCSVLEFQEGEEAGVQSATLQIDGEYAYGHLKAETGVHRLVRISPFDSNARRHTSFAASSVTPQIDDSIDVEINDADLRVDTYRSSGAGGQHVNKTDSAVRLTHIPTGVVVACQQERSQHKNRATAMKMLAAKLYALEEEKQRAQADAIAGDKGEINFGSQIRSYVLQPYQMVKDLRTGHEVGQPQSVLDGDLDGFIEAYLLQQANA
ncbi:MAG: peptide chain release factor 2 [Myxococcota bacterium]|nr:peptide chain release factor 2 [Myxococcota bacterium]